MSAENRPWPAPAKLNLFLHILGRRSDGYHELQTCFQFIDLCDEIAIAPRTSFFIEGRFQSIVPKNGDPNAIANRPLHFLPIRMGFRF